jgi:hypothetical protein
MLGVSPCGQFRLDQYRGVPVFRISTPAEALMDWRPFNEEHENIFAQILEMVRPTLIHFHCIQRLTASIVEVALSKKIPYVITVHDGWWISDSQFFVDEDDVLRLPSSDPYSIAISENISLIDSVVRRQRLEKLLESARKVICVSEAFSEIYRRAGCPKVITIPNGVSKMQPTPRQKKSSGRLSLGHIGGRSAHKGAKMLEAVLRTNNFSISS